MTLPRQRLAPHGRLTSDVLTDDTQTETARLEYGYDDAGNRIQAGSDTYTYDERNRLLSGLGASYS